MCTECCLSAVSLWVWILVTSYPVTNHKLTCSRYKLHYFCQGLTIACVDILPAGLSTVGASQFCGREFADRCGSILGATIPHSLSAV